MDSELLDILEAPPPPPDVVPVEYMKGQQPNFRPAAEVQLENLQIGITKLFGTNRRPLRHSYAALPKQHIRVLVIKPGQPGTQLELFLVAIPFDESTTDQKHTYHYEALSYEWDSGIAIYPVLLRDHSVKPEDRFPIPEGSTKKEKHKIYWKRAIFHAFRAAGTTALIQANLRNALEHFRHEKNPVRIWADALCINQIDDNEKATQISMMGSIYNRAFNVRIWLGGANEQSDIAMDYIRELQGENASKTYFAEEGKSELEEQMVKWPAIFELMTCRWFSRRWVVQEVALAKKASVYCGKKAVTWDDFASAISTFMDRAKPEELEHETQGDGQTGKKRLTTEGLRTLKGSGAIALVAAKSDLVRFGSQGEVIERKKSLEDLVSTLTAFDCGDPRDVIYAVLSVASGDAQKHIKPHESRSLLQLYTEFIRYCAEILGSLDMIGRHWAPNNTVVVKALTKEDKRRFVSVLPTWIGTLEESTFGTPDKIFRGQKEARSLIGTPTHTLYKASSGRSPQLTFGKRERPDNPVVLIDEYDGTARVTGIKLGAIQEVSARLIPGLLPREALELAGWAHSCKDESLKVEDVPDKLLRTLVANRTADGLPLPSNWRLYCLKMLQLEDIHGDIHIDKIMARNDVDKILWPFIQRVRDATFNRKFFVAGQLFGLCPKRAHQGDIICIPYGCSVPLVLRACRSKPVFGLDAESLKKNDPLIDPNPNPTPRPGTEVLIENVGINESSNSTSRLVPSASDDPVPATNQEEEKDAVVGAEPSGMDDPLHAINEPNPWNEDESTSPTSTGPSSIPSVAITPRRSHTIAGSQFEYEVSRISAPVMQQQAAYDQGSNAPEVADDAFYEVIGECYVDDKMEGEACPRYMLPDEETEFVLI